MTLKNRGRLKKSEWCTAPKSRGGSLAVGAYLQRGSAPPHPPTPPAPTVPENQIRPTSHGLELLGAFH